MLTTLTAVDPAPADRGYAAKRLARIVAVASGLGAPDPRCADGPGRLLESGMAERLASSGVANALWSVVHAERTTPSQRYRALGRLCSRIAGEVAAVMACGGLPVVLGGDHTCAIGTWSGVARATSSSGPFGMVWIDAHMDSHTPMTSHSGMPHGMPLASLLGYGGRRRLPADLVTLVSDSPLSPAHTSLVGIRSFEPEEAALLERLGVRVFAMDEIAARGLKAVMDEAVERAGSAAAGYGISIDLDAVDPSDAPGVGSPVHNGIPGLALLEALACVRGDGRLLGVEVAEYNPHRDVGGRTATLVEDLLRAALGGS